MATSIDTVNDFLAQRRLALVGVSENPKDMSREIFRELTRRGYQVTPINRKGGVIEGALAYPSVSALPRADDKTPPVDGVIVMVPPSQSPAVVAECAKAGVSRVWLHRGVGPGATSPDASRLAQESGIRLVDGECPMMFLGGGVHAFHGAMRRLGGTYPAGGVAPARPVVAIVLAMLLLLVGVSALGAGIMMVVDPSGGLLGMSPALLAKSPFSTFLIPGLVLASVNGLGQLAVAAMVLRARPAAPKYALLLGVALCVWIVFQMLWLAEFSWLQPVILSIGVAEFFLALGLARAKPGASSTPKPSERQAEADSRS